MTGHPHAIPIWFFIGLLLLIYGILMISCILWLPNGVLSLRFRRGHAAEEEDLAGPAVEPGRGNAVARTGYANNC